MIHADLGDTLEQHGAPCKWIGTHTGAAVDLVEFKLDKGTKLAKVQALAPDLALAVGVESVRILAPIPGTTNIGIEVPAADRDTVGYHTILISHNNKAILPFPVGQQVGNGVIWADLADAPHLLIAGATGSGKSVALNTILTSLIDHVDADSLRLHLVDPKRVELGQFKDAPQVESFVTTVDDAVDLLDDLVDEMERRYELFESAGVRNIGEFNTAEHVMHNALPYHVLVIDEMADLMSQRKDDVEPLIQRLTQLARAAGIHLILATQRPSVNVITGVIKANVPSRWCFTVASGVDSKVVLDTTGAEALYGQGDSLWAPYGALKPLRVQGVWTSDEEVERAVFVANERTGGGVSFAASTLNQRAANEGDPLSFEDMGIPAPLNMGPRDSLELADDRELERIGYKVAEPVARPATIKYEAAHDSLVARDGNGVPIDYNAAEPVTHYYKGSSEPTPKQALQTIVDGWAERDSIRGDQFLAWGRLATIWAVVAGVVILVVTR